MSRRVLLLALLLLVLGGLGVRSLHQVQRQVAISDACDAASERRFDEAIALSEGLTGTDADGDAALGCRCLALIQTNRTDACLDEVEGVMSAPDAAGWLPPEFILMRLVNRLVDRGRYGEASTLARQGRIRQPTSLGLYIAEIKALAEMLPPQQAIAQVEAALQDTPSPEDLRLLLAQSYFGHELYPDAARVLGETPFVTSEALTNSWYLLKAESQAKMGEATLVELTLTAWKEAGADPLEARAYLLMFLSENQLMGQTRWRSQHLIDLVDEAEKIEDDVLRSRIYRRAISHLAAGNLYEEALEVYAKASSVLQLNEGMAEQLRQQKIYQEQGQDPQFGRLVFTSTPAVTGTLYVSQDQRSPGDAPYEALPMAPGAAALRVASPWPMRWVLKDAGGDVRGSGAAWVTPGQDVAVAITPTEPVALRSRPLPPQKAGDGRRRVIVIIPDCGDWRLAQYLRTRGEMPTLDGLIAGGLKGTLHSYPALTASAMESIVWPTRGNQATFFDLVARVGLEMGGLASVGKNPLSFMTWVQAEGQSLFETLGAGPRVAANMLFSHGGIDAGHHAEMIGPEGLVRTAPVTETDYTLTPEDLTHLTALQTLGPDAKKSIRGNLERIGGELDAALTLVEDDTVDLLLLRLEALDLITHGTFGTLTRPEQDNGAHILLDAYRWIDLRLAAVVGALDEDDILVVMSDHGIRTALEHDTEAMLVVYGGGVPQGRAPGRANLKGIPLALARLFGESPRWPDSGIRLATEPAPEGEAPATP